MARRQPCVRIPRLGHRWTGPVRHYPAVPARSTLRSTRLPTAGRRSASRRVAYRFMGKALDLRSRSTPPRRRWSPTCGMSDKPSAATGRDHDAQRCRSTRWRSAVIPAPGSWSSASAAVHAARTRAPAEGLAKAIVIENFAATLQKVIDSGRCRPSQSSSPAGRPAPVSQVGHRQRGRAPGSRRWCRCSAARRSALNDAIAQGRGSDVSPAQVGSTTSRCWQQYRRHDWVNKGAVLLHRNPSPTSCRPAPYTSRR